MDPITLIHQGKIKRFFRATRKINAPRIVSHLTQRAAGREPLFLEDSDYLTMLGLLKDVAAERSIEIFAFCLMPNHLHLLLRPDGRDLPDAMRDLFSRYASRFNRKYERKGHLFGSPYRQAICLDEGYLTAASLYIHSNPVKAGLCESATDYRWSSALLYCSEKSLRSFVSYEFILKLLGGGERGKSSYRRMLDGSRDLQPEIVFEKPDAVERFRDRLAALFPAIFRSFRRMKALTDVDLLDSEELEEQIDALKKGSTGGSPATNKARKFLIEQLISRGFTKTDIARRLGLSRKTVYNILARDVDEVGSKRK